MRSLRALSIRAPAHAAADAQCPASLLQGLAGEAYIGGSGFLSSGNGGSGGLVMADPLGWQASCAAAGVDMCPSGTLPANTCEVGAAYPYGTPTLLLNGTDNTNYNGIPANGAKPASSVSLPRQIGYNVGFNPESSNYYGTNDNYGGKTAFAVVRARVRARQHTACLHAR